MIFLEFEIQSQNKGQEHESFLRRVKSTAEKISIRKVLYYIFVYFISVSNAPLTCAIFAAQYDISVPLPTLILVLLGGFTPPFSAFNLLKTVSAIFIFSAFHAKFKFKKTPLLKAFVMSLCTFFCDALPKVFGGLVFYDLIILFMRASFVFLCTYFFQTAKNIFFSGEREADESSLLGLFVFIGAAIYGIGFLSVGGVNIGVFFASLVVLLFTTANSASLSVGMGTLVGAALGLSLHQLPFYVTLFSCTSLISGFFLRFGRSSVALSFVLGTSLVAFFSPSSTQGFEVLTQISLAALTFIFLPEKTVSAFSLGQTKSSPYSLELKKYISKSISEKAGLIENLADIYTSLCQSHNLRQTAASSFFERATGRLCGECSMKDTCWRSEFHRTYSAFFVLIEVCNKNGSVSYCDIPEFLMKKCTKTGQIAPIFNNVYDIYKVDRLWECQSLESRSLIGVGLHEISENILSSASSFEDDIIFSHGAEKKILHGLKNDNIETKSIFVCSRKNGDFKVEITLSDPNISTDEVEKSVSHCLGENFKCTFRLGKFIHLVPLFEKDILTAIASKPRQGFHKSGDTATFCHLPGKRYMALLSDGMGSGDEASAESDACTRIATTMLQGDFNPTSAAQIINSALLLKSFDTSFASVDMVIIDKLKSEADFYKMGAAPSFIKSGDKVKTIYATTLPAGSFSKSDIGHINCSVKKGDIIIMVSDGIANGENTDELEKLISDLDCDTPSAFSEEILSYTASPEKKSSDDLTVMVTFL